MLMTTDTHLLARVTDGDRAAFESVFAASFDAVYAFAARRTGGRSEAEALTEKILRRTFAALGDYAGDVPFAAWLLEMAKRVEREERGRRTPERARGALPLAESGQPSRR